MTESDIEQARTVIDDAAEFFSRRGLCFGDYHALLTTARDLADEVGRLQACPPPPAAVAPPPLIDPRWLYGQLTHILALLVDPIDMKPSQRAAILASRLTELRCMAIQWDKATAPPAEKTAA